jgi:NADP-reducing hydrogenase subunit HndB
MASENGAPVKKIRSLKDLQEVKEKVQSRTALRQDGYRACVTVHMGTCGIAAGARDVLSALMDEMAACDRRDIRITTSGCIGICVQEPVMTVEFLGAEPIIYGKLDSDKARLIFREHVLEGKVVPQLALGRGKEQLR